MARKKVHDRVATTINLDRDLREALDKTKNISETINNLLRAAMKAGFTEFVKEKVRLESENKILKQQVEILQAEVDRLTAELGAWEAKFGSQVQLDSIFKKEERFVNFLRSFAANAEDGLKVYEVFEVCGIHDRDEQLKRLKKMFKVEDDGERLVPRYSQLEGWELHRAGTDGGYLDYTFREVRVVEVIEA